MVENSNFRAQYLFGTKVASLRQFRSRRVSNLVPVCTERGDVNVVEQINLVFIMHWTSDFELDRFFSSDTHFPGNVRHGIELLAFIGHYFFKFRHRVSTFPTTASNFFIFVSLSSGELRIWMRGTCSVRVNRILTESCTLAWAGWSHYCRYFLINPFVSNAPFLYPLKTSENLTVFWCFQGLEKGCIWKERVKLLIHWFLDAQKMYLELSQTYMMELFPK